MVNSIVLRSFAKINLGLLVKDKRADGYHNIETILVLVRLSDKIRLKKISNGILIKTINHKIKIPQGKNNLAYQAASLFIKEVNITEGIEISIEKNIPIGAGLGGASSNAATVLQGLNYLYGQPLNKKMLNNLALELGMDVPFFLRGKACYATGRGEILKPIKIPKLDIVLHFPGYPVFTKWAYQQISKSSRLPKKRLLTNGVLSLKILRKKLLSGDLKDLQRYLKNSFENFVFAHHPELAEIKEFFLTHGADAASLTGSGSAIFALVRRPNIPALKTALKHHNLAAVFTESLNL